MPNKHGKEQISIAKIGGDAARAALAMAAVAKRYAEDRKLINDSKDNC